MWRTCPVAPRHVGSSQTRAQTCAPCIGRQILNHCATRAAPSTYFLNDRTKYTLAATYHEVNEASAPGPLTCTGYFEDPGRGPNYAFPGSCVFANFAKVRYLNHNWLRSLTPLYQPPHILSVHGETPGISVVWLRGSCIGDIFSLGLVGHS